jgi:cobyrinic acid a,c-diamide synthase
MMLSEIRASGSLMLSLKENLLTGKLLTCKAYQLEGYSSFTANTKVQGVIHVQKKAKRHYSFCLSKLNVKPKLYKMYRANVSYIGKILRTK